MLRRPSVYIGVIHILALIGVVQCIRMVRGLNADPPPRIEVRVQGVIAPQELPVLPDGSHKSELRAEQVFIDNEPVASNRNVKRGRTLRIIDGNAVERWLHNGLWPIWLRGQNRLCFRPEGALECSHGWSEVRRA